MKHRGASAEQASEERPAEYDHGYQEHTYTEKDFEHIFYDLSRDYGDEGANEA